MGKDKYLIYLLYLFAFLGVLVSAYMWYEYSQPEEITCQLEGCQAVRESEYSKLFGIDIPVYGFAFYLSIAIFAMRLLTSYKVQEWEKAIFILAITGAFAFSIYLTYLELFVIFAICQWCVISALLSLGIYFVGYILFNPLEIKLR